MDNLDKAEPEVSRASIDFSFEDAKGIVLVGLIVITLAIVFLLFFGLEIPGPVEPHFNMLLAGLLLLVPPLIYLFSFWAYRQILFNEQVKIALNLYNTDSEFREKIKQKVQIELDNLKSTLNKEAEKKINGKKANEKKIKGKKKFLFWGCKQEVEIELTEGEDLPIATVAQEIRKQLDIEASRAVASVYGVSLSAYFPVLIILELVVILGFVVPIYELMSTGYIGVFNLSLWPGTVTVNSWIVEWAFFGAFVHSFFNMMDRVPRKDVRPSFYLNILIRYIIAIALASVFYLGYELFIITDDTVSIAPMALLGGIAFIIGMFPNVFLRTIATGFASRIKLSLSSDMPLTDLPEISRMEASRLWEEGIQNIGQLADSNVFELHKRTHYDVCRLHTMIGTALLWRLISGSESIQSNGQKEKTTRMAVLRSYGIITIKDLYSFINSPNTNAEKKEDKTQHYNTENLKFLSQKLELDQNLLLNAAMSYLEYKKDQLKIPLKAVESVVM